VSTFRADWSFRPDARAAYDALTQADRAAVDRRIDSLCLDPYPDDELKFAIDEDDEMTGVYFDDNEWALTYYIFDKGWYIEIWAIALIGR
jgi:hypothetical protein